MRFLKIIPTFFVATLLLLGCAKEYSVETGGKKLATGNWEFKDSTREYMGLIDTAYIAEAGNMNQLNLIGKSLDGKENWSMRFYADTIKVGNYKASLFQTSMKYTGSGKSIYEVNQVSGDFTGIITAISGNLITGTFSGSARDSLGVIKKIFAGKFKATLKKPIIEPESAGVLGSTGGNCDEVVISGEYKQGITLLPSNTVEIKVVVATPGTYKIYTNTVNGISFYKQGVFTTAGPKTVILNASGTPAFQGDQMFTLYYGNSQCAFKVNFLQGVSASNDYYPLTTNTNWTYSDGTNSVKNQVLADKKSTNGFNYSVIASYNPPTASTFDTLLLARKAANLYYAFGDHGAILQLDEPVYGDLPFLADNVAAGNGWTTNVLNGKLAGVPITFFYKYTVLEKGVPETVGGFEFPNVIKVKQEVIINTSTVATSETWYAKNVGPVKMIQGGNTFIISGFQVF